MYLIKISRVITSYYSVYLELSNNKKLDPVLISCLNETIILIISILPKDQLSIFYQKIDFYEKSGLVCENTKFYVYTFFKERKNDQALLNFLFGDFSFKLGCNYRLTPDKNIALEHKLLF